MDLYKCEDDLTAQIAARLSGLWPLYLLGGGKMMWIGVQKGGEMDWTEAPGQRECHAWGIYVLSICRWTSDTKISIERLTGGVVGQRINEFNSLCRPLSDQPPFAETARFQTIIRKL